MLQLSKAILEYNDQSIDLPINKMSFFDELYVDFKMVQEGIYLRFIMTIHPKQDIVLKNVELQFQKKYNGQDRIFCNGFQSWSESRTFGLNEKISNLKGFAKKHLGYYGDYHFKDIPRSKGHFHSWTYSYIQSGNNMDFVGSLTENTAFTLIQHDTKKDILSVKKDVAELQLSHSYPVLDILIMNGQEQAVFDQYFKLMDIDPPKAPSLTGWTSWYNYYTNISEEIILKNAAAFAEKKVPIDIIQIDDGYQTKIGDWLNIKNTFPNGMAKVANEIHQKGFKAGIWMAPFVCEKESDIFKTKKEWLLKDEQGNPVAVGYNPLWSGWFYALDFYNQDFQKHLSGVLYTALSKWGYDLLKLDFLYAVCVLPRANKTRGQIMYDAMQFLRETIGDKWILGCGVPLGSSFGLVDYCRIGADIHLKWEHQLLKLVGNRERVSTIIALRTVLGRWQLNGHVFHNDPDVFILREENNKLSSTQQYSILLINTLLGNLLFTSDFVGDYNEEQWAEFDSIYKWKDSSIKQVESLNANQYLIHFRNNDKDFIAFCNLESKAVTINHQKLAVPLEAYECIVLAND